MYREIWVQNEEVESLAEGLADNFIQRCDLYARQLEDGSYVCIRKPLRIDHILTHLQGEITLGIYVLDRDSQTHFVVFDADDDQGMSGLISMAADLDDKGVPSYIETSRRGGHLWLFLHQRVSGREARQFASGIAHIYDLDTLELFPKQDRLSSGPGSLVRLPFGIHRKSGERYCFIDLDEQPIASSLYEQICLLSDPQTVPVPAFEDYRNLGSTSDRKPVFTRSEAVGDTLSQQIKNRITVLEFVSQYVELSPNGRALCPFHDDKRASFSVNDEENYWHCFAGCGGGSVIDFWMKFRDCDFKTAVAELETIILEAN